MPAERVTTRKIKGILRLKWTCRLSNRRVAAICEVAQHRSRDRLHRAPVAPPPTVTTALWPAVKGPQ